MAIISVSFFSCFSGAANKVMDEGNDKNSASRKLQNVDEDHKTKVIKSRKTAPIPVAHFPIGSNFSRL